MAESAHVFDVTDETFPAEVLERSQQTTVVVDFWAEWCAPCRALGPTLEKLVDKLDGQIVLAKADTEQNAMAATQFGVQSIPAVFAVRDGQVIDGFNGALPEAEIKEWLARLLPSEAEQKIASAKEIATKDQASAEKMLREAIELDANNAMATIELARLLTESDRTEEASEIIEQLEERGFLEPEAEQIKSKLALRAGGEQTASVEQCRQTVQQNPDDLEARIQLAKALAAEAAYEEALQHALHVVEHDFGDRREAGRKLMVDIFRELPDDSELTGNYRRQLATALY